MAKIVQLTGAASFSSPRTYGVALKLAHTIKMRDADADALLLLTTKNVTTNAVVQLFTLAGPSFDFDVSNRYDESGLVQFDAMNNVLVRNGQAIGRPAVL